VAGVPSFRRVAATLEEVAPLVEWIGQRAREAGVPEPRAAGLEIAFEEALVNVCTHAYPPPSSGSVRIRADATPAAFAVEIEDEGVPFNPLLAAEANVTAQLEERRIGGLGIHFLKRFTDDAAYRRTDGANVLTLTVRLTR
jgi:anti-sigma regulatory factor (Ser/Thr protein kinase)